jgi:hypothetical protein
MRKRERREGDATLATEGQTNGRRLCIVQDRSTMHGIDGVRRRRLRCGRSPKSERSRPEIRRRSQSSAMTGQGPGLCGTKLKSSHFATKRDGRHGRCHHKTQPARQVEDYMETTRHRPRRCLQLEIAMLASRYRCQPNCCMALRQPLLCLYSASTLPPPGPPLGPRSGPHCLP